MAYRWLITASGRDCPGIVAGVTGVLFKLGCNLEDSAMTRLEGEFAMMLIFSSQKKLSSEALMQEFLALQKRSKIQVWLKVLTGSGARPKRSQGVRPFILSVYGKDQTGIVHRFASLLAQADVNITDVETHRAVQTRKALYLLLLELEVPRSLSIEGLRRRISRLAVRLNVEASIKPAETEVL